MTCARCGTPITFGQVHRCSHGQPYTLKEDRNALKERIKAMSPEQQNALLRNLIEFACDADEYRDMPIEQVEAELRASGFTDEDFDRMNKRIDAILKKYASPAPPRSAEGEER